MLLEACLSLRYWACVWNVRMRAHSYYGLTWICEEAIRLPGCMRYHERMEAQITNKWTSLCMFPALTSSTRKKKTAYVTRISQIVTPQNPWTQPHSPGISSTPIPASNKPTKVSLESSQAPTQQSPCQNLSSTSQNAREEESKTHRTVSSRARKWHRVWTRIHTCYNYQ